MSDKELMQEALKWQEHIKVLANGHADDELYQTRLEVFNWLIEQAEKYEKLQERYLSGVELALIHAKFINQEYEIKRLREVLEFYANGNHYSDKLYDDKIILLDDGEKARQALGAKGNEHS